MINILAVIAFCFLGAVLEAQTIEKSARPLTEPHAAAELPSTKGDKDSFAIFGTSTIADGSIEGVSRDRHLLLLGARYSRTLGQTKWLKISYTPEIIPVALLSQPVVVLGVRTFTAPEKFPGVTQTQTTYGAGATPLGFELQLFPDGRIHPIIGGGEGFLYFTKNVPSDLAAQFNFTLDVRFGLGIRLGENKGLSCEYVYHHFSNAYHAEDNPGVDSQMLYLAYSFNLHKRTR